MWFVRIYESYYRRGLFRQEGPFKTKQIADAEAAGANISAGGKFFVVGSDQ